MNNINKSNFNIAVLIGGNGSNLQAIIDADIGNISAVISHNPKAYGLVRAKNHQIPNFVIDHTLFSDRSIFEQQLAQVLDSINPDLIVLAGFMRILSSEFISKYPNKIINIHPSLLPKYKGLNTHQRVIDANEKYSGASVHIVTPKLDSGANLAQIRVPVLGTDTAEDLATRVHLAEHFIYPKVINWFATGRININADSIFMDHEKLSSTGVLYEFKDIDQKATS